MRRERRRLLQAGLAGGALLAVAGWLGVAGRPHPSGLRAAEREMLAAIAGVLLAGALPDDPALRRQAIGRTLGDLEETVAGLSTATRREVAELFALLASAPARRLLAGVPAAWSSAAPGEVAAFLERWRHSRFTLLRSGYAALHDLLFGAWYARSEHWAAIGYPGPPEVF
jgi:hypothetical protein